MNLAVSYEVLRFAFIGTVTSALFIATYTVTAAPSRVASRLGMRGLKRQRALADNPLWAQVEPLVRWLGVRVSGVLEDPLRGKMDRQLALAGDYLGLTPEEYLALSILSMFGGAAFGAVAGQMLDMGLVLALATTPLGAAMGYLAVSGEQTRRMKQIGRGLPYAADLLALAMSAGQDFPGAIRQVVEKSSDPDDALVEEFSRMLQELQVGMTRKQALLSFADRAPLETVTEFVSAIVQAEERGNPVAEVLQIQAGVSRMRRSVKAEEAAAKAGVQMVGPLFLLFFCIMLLVMGPMVLQLAATAD
jgi:tight adherence protein C